MAKRAPRAPRAAGAPRAGRWSKWKPRWHAKKPRGERSRLACGAEDEDVEGIQATEQKEILAEQLNEEQRKAAERALRGENLFLTGAAGTGKSFLLRYLIQELENKYPGKVAVTASTGVAASHLAGQTLHSFAGVGIGRLTHQTALKKVKQNGATARWRDTQVLVVDEISMVEGQFFELLEGVACSVRKCKHAFGGMQVLFCGDFFQLPPVQERGGPKTSFCFATCAWKKAELDQGTVVLRTAVRQQGDADFAEVLAEMRLGIVSQKAKAMLAKCHVKVKPPPVDQIVPTKLYCLNRDVDKENAKRLAQLPGEALPFRGRDQLKRRATAAQLQALDRKVPKEVSLKVGAQVIHLCNDPALGLVNGHRGRVEAFEHGKPVVRFDNGKRVCIGIHKFTQGQGSSMLTRFQVPLKLGWALTVHKAQGMTLTRAELQVDNAFEAGQSYVALSRLTGTAGLWIRGKQLETCRAHPEVLRFYEEAVKAQEELPAEDGLSTLSNLKGIEEPSEAAVMRALPGPQGKRPGSTLLERLLKRSRGKDLLSEDQPVKPSAVSPAAKDDSNRWVIPLKEWCDPIQID